MNSLVLPAIHRGYISTYVGCAVWAAIFLLAAFWLSSEVNAFLQSFNVASLRELNNLSYQELEMHDVPFCAMLIFFKYLCFILTGFAVLMIVETLICSAWTVNTFFKDEDGHWNKVVKKWYSFPFGKATEQAVFDRVVSIAVHQSSLDRLFNTGSVEVKMITFTNADSKQTKWWIEAINDPYERKAELEQALSGRAGLEIRLSRKEYA